MCTLTLTSPAPSPALDLHQPWTLISPRLDAPLGGGEPMGGGSPNTHRGGAHALDPTSLGDS